MAAPIRVFRFAAVLKHDQLGAGRAIENFDEVFWVSIFE